MQKYFAIVLFLAIAFAGVPLKNGSVVDVRFSTATLIIYYIDHYVQQPSKHGNFDQ